tara:strand:- start:20231 stop:21427 length:1197 start_codon:yes stop_codon:yes gene_type:complete
MSEEVKQEGSFKIKKKTPKKLVGKSEVTKVDLTKKEENNAIQEQSTDEVSVRDEPKTSEGVREQDNKETVEEPAGKNNNDDGKTEVETPIQLIEEKDKEEKDATTEEKTELKQEPKEVIQKEAKEELPENINKLIEFMKETGGDIQDYARLNADYSNVDDYTLIREYYKQTKPHLDTEDVNVILEDFDYDKEVDDPKDIRKKQIAYKEEVAKAKNFLEQTKKKYYEEIKLKPSVNSEQQKALDFFNRYKQEEQSKEAIRQGFVDRTNNYFSNDFKGFDFKLGDKKFRYGIKDPNSVANSQNDLSQFVGTFLDKDGQMSDPAGYHKAIYTARNADTIANHFYEQGRTDAIKEQVAKSKNISTEPRPTASGEVFVNGLKVKAISGLDSSKLKIKTRKIKN